jgi:hypothetical protein
MIGLAAAEVAGASVVRTPASLISIPSVRQMVSAQHKFSSLGGGVEYADRNVGYSASLYQLRSSGGAIHRQSKDCRGCAWHGNNAGSAVALSSRLATANLASLTALPNPPETTFIVAKNDLPAVSLADIVFVSGEDADAVRFAGASFTSLEGDLVWRSSSFSVAGSRIWSKLIKFSSSGINVRVPLN